MVVQHGWVDDQGLRATASRRAAGRGALPQVASGLADGENERLDGDVPTMPFLKGASEKQRKGNSMRQA